MKGIRQTGAERMTGGRKLPAPSKRLAGRVTVCAILVSLLVTLSGGGPALCDEGMRDKNISPEDISWYPTFEDAKAAAKKSGKPVYIHFDDPVAFWRNKAELLDRPEVVPLLAQFECCAHSLEIEANEALARKYVLATDGRGLRRGDVMLSRIRAFTDAEGRKLYVRQGSILVPEFVQILKHVLAAARLDAALRETPDDPQLNAQLGHVYVELEDYDSGRRYLRQALANDPENKAGARDDAELDLILIRIPNGPEKAYAALLKYEQDFPETDRALEVRYYRAVALVAQGTELVEEANDLLREAEIIYEKREAGWLKRVREAKKRAAELHKQAFGPYDQALPLLDTFKTNDNTRPEYNSPWAPRAIDLRSQVRAVLGLAPD